MNELVKKHPTNLPQKSAVRRAGTSPFTLIPTVSGVTFIVLSVVQNTIWWGILGFLMLSGAFGLFIILTLFFKAGMFVNEKKVKLLGNQEIKKLSKKLKGHDDYQASKQLSHLEECYNNFKTRLSDRIGTKAVEYNQYLTPAEEMYDAAIRNLKAIGHLHDDITVAHVKEAEKEFNRLKAADEATMEDVENLKKKITIAKQAENRIIELKKEVDTATTVLIEVANQLNDIVTDRDEVQKSLAVAVSKFNKAADLNRRINEKVKAAWEALS